MQDVIVIGGSYAGMAAALQLVRARRKVTVMDAGQRRNRFASSSHGFFGQDGADPAEIWGEARTQLLAYPTLTWVDGSVSAISGLKDDFLIGTEAGQSVSARRVLLAIGVTDCLPDIPGLADRWGRSVFHCPYCHGYELEQGRIGVIGTSAMSLHQAQLLSEWGAVTFLTNGGLTLEPAHRADLIRRGVTVDERQVLRISGHAEVELKDGNRLSFAGLFTATRTVPSSPLAQSVGCAMVETPMGMQIMTGDSKETSVPGIFASGDVARAPHSVSLAVGDGAWAGAQVHRSLVWPES